MVFNYIKCSNEQIGMQREEKKKRNKKLILTWRCKQTSFKWD